MTGVLLDTHAVLWHLLAAPQLSAPALALIEETVRKKAPLYVSAISLLEVVYLVEKQRVPGSALQSLVAALAQPDSDLVCVPFDMATALAAHRIGRDEVPDMPDRVIAATALHLGVPLVTRDSKVQKAGVQTVW